MYGPNLRKSNMRKPLLSLIAAMMLVAVAVSPARSDDQKPKTTPTEVIVLTFGKLEQSYKVDGSSGPDVAIQGALHIASQTLVAGDGTPIGFTLHTNLSDSFAVSVDGTQSYAAVGAVDGIPAECEPAACAPPSWTLTFRLVPEGRALQSSLLFDVTLITEYAANGMLLKACIAGEEGCDTGERIP